MSAMEDTVGVAGPKFLRQLLTTCTDPIEAIHGFQTENSIRLLSLNPALRLLDLHNVSRTHYHESVLSDLQERLVKQIQTLAAKNERKDTKMVESLLDKSFPLVDVPFVREVVVECLESLPRIPHKYLRKILQHPTLYPHCPMKVKQQIWVLDEQLFRKEVEPEIAAYLAEKTRNLRNVELVKSEYFRKTGKSRRQVAGIQKLVKIVGDHVTLYDSLLQYIRKGFLDTKSMHYCSLRFDLLMALHDNDVKALIELDPCHRFAWCLDPCVRDKHLHPNQSAELKSFMDAKKRDVEIWGDVAMIASDPQVTFFFGKLVILYLKQHGIAAESLPRELPTMQLILRILSLGSEVETVMGGEEKLRDCGKVDQLIFTKFLPSLLLFMSEDILRTEVAKLEDTQEFEEVNTLSTPPKLLIDFLKSESLCATIWLQYVLELAKNKDCVGLVRAIPLLSKCKGKIAYAEPFLQEFFTRIVSFAGLSTGVGVESWCSTSEFFDVVVENFLNGGLDEFPHLIWHLLRLLFHLGGRMPLTPTDRLLLKLNPATLLHNTETSSGDDHGGAYAKVQQRIAAVRADKEIEIEGEASGGTGTEVVKRLDLQNVLQQ